MGYTDILSILLGGLASFFCVSAYLVFLHCFYDTGYKWHWKKACLILLCAIAGSAVTFFAYRNESLVVLLTIVEVIVFLCKCVAVIYDYEGKKLRGMVRFLFLSLIVEELMGTMAIMSASLILPDFDLWNVEQIATTSYFLFTYILYALFFGIVFAYLYIKLYRPGIVIKRRKRELVFLIIYPLICMAVCYSIAYLGKDSNITLIILASLSLLLALIFPVFAYYTRINQHYREQTLYQENYMQAELDHFIQYKQSQEETARFRHDIRNNLLCIRELLQDGKTEEATQYLQDLLHTSDTLRQKHVTGDEMLDCIIGVKAQSMEEQDIKFQLDGVIAGGLHWKPMDICIVFANALDNAIEACRALPPEERNIRFAIRSTPQYWFISIENPTPTQVDTGKLFRKNGGFTTKPDADHHGIGTYNMKRTVESYGGLLEARYENETFSLELMLDKSNT